MNLKRFRIPLLLRVHMWLFMSNTLILQVTQNHLKSSNHWVFTVSLGAQKKWNEAEKNKYKPRGKSHVESCNATCSKQDLCLQENSCFEARTIQRTANPTTIWDSQCYGEWSCTLKPMKFCMVFQPWWLMIPGFFFQVCTPWNDERSLLLAPQQLLHDVSAWALLPSPNAGTASAGSDKVWRKKAWRGPRDWQKIVTKCDQLQDHFVFCQCPLQTSLARHLGLKNVPPWCWKLGAKYHQKQMPNILESSLRPKV